jgi:hypothetical protein
MSRRSRIFLAVMVACCLNGATSPARGIDRPDSLDQKRSSLVALPYAYYTPETKFAFGAGSIYSFRSPGSPPWARPSNLRVAITYTQLHQLIVGFLPEIYLRNETYFFSGYYGFYKYPDKFWGIGNNTQESTEEDYEPLYFKSHSSVQRRIMPGLYVGLRYQYEYIDLWKTDPVGILQYGTVPGSEGGSASGIGVIVNHDTRNHVYQPSSGFYNQIYAVFFGGAIGSDYEFNMLSIDLRAYLSLFDSHVLALQMYDGFISGDPPFQMLNRLGSSYWMRGYYEGRYRDRNMISFQAEYRFPIVWRFGGVAFTGIGDVGDTTSSFRLDEFKYSFGFGFRFMFDAQERINARLDIGFGGDDNVGIYALVLEAF